MVLAAACHATLLVNARNQSLSASVDAVLCSAFSPFSASANPNLLIAIEHRCMHGRALMQCLENNFVLTPHTAITCCCCAALPCFCSPFSARCCVHHNLLTMGTCTRKTNQTNVRTSPSRSKPLIQPINHSHILRMETIKCSLHCGCSCQR